MNPRWITWKGQTYALSDWARLRGLSAPTLYKRLKAGWSAGEALGFVSRPGSGPSRRHGLTYNDETHFYYFDLPKKYEPLRDNYPHIAVLPFAKFFTESDELKSGSIY